jgi:mycothiol system anti-sigma-R factor
MSAEQVDVSADPTGATPLGGARTATCGEGCVEALETLEAYLDGELPEARVADLAEHLRACYPCADRVSFEEQLRNLVRRRCVDHAPSDLVDRVRARLRAELPQLQEDAPLA